MPLSTLHGLWHCGPLLLRILLLWTIQRLMLKPHMLHSEGNAHCMAQTFIVAVEHNFSTRKLIFKRSQAENYRQQFLSNDQQERLLESKC